MLLTNEVANPSENIAITDSCVLEVDYNNYV